MITVNNRDKIEWEDGFTVKDLLHKMNYKYSLISVHVNDEYVAEEYYAGRVIPDNSSVQIIHLAHGG